MSKKLLATIILGFFITSCRQANLPTPVATATLSPTLTLPTLITEVNLETESNTSYTLDWSPDGETLAVASGYEITLLSRDLSTTQAILKPEGGALALTWSPGQTRLATVNGYQNRTIRIWDWEEASTGLNFVREIQAGSDQYAVFWSPDGKLVMTLADDDKSTFQIWDTSTWTELHKYSLPYANPRRTLSWSADSLWLYGAGESNGQVIIYRLQVADGSIQEMAAFPVAEVEAFAFSPDASRLVVANSQGAVQMIDAASGVVLMGFKSVDQPVDLAWNPDGTTLAVLGYKTILQLWNVSG